MGVGKNWRTKFLTPRSFIRFLIWVNSKCLKCVLLLFPLNIAWQFLTKIIFCDILAALSNNHFPPIITSSNYFHTIVLKLTVTGIIEIWHNDIIPIKNAWICTRQMHLLNIFWWRQSAFEYLNCANSRLVVKNVCTPIVKSLPIAKQWLQIITKYSLKNHQYVNINILINTSNTTNYAHNEPFLASRNFNSDRPQFFESAFSIYE